MLVFRSGLNRSLDSHHSSTGAANANCGQFKSKFAFMPTISKFYLIPSWVSAGALKRLQLIRRGINERHFVLPPVLEWMTSRKVPSLNGSRCHWWRRGKPSGLTPSLLFHNWVVWSDCDGEVNLLISPYLYPISLLYFFYSQFLVERRMENAARPTKANLEARNSHLGNMQCSSLGIRRE